MKHTSLKFHRSRALSAALSLLCAITGPSSLAAQEKNADAANAAATPAVSSADVITVPDGKRVETKLTKNLSTATAKVGDDLELTVSETVRQDGLVIIPKGAVLSARITSVHHARRMARSGSVSFSVENAVFPGGEISALRPAPPATAGKKLRDGVKGVGSIAADPEFGGFGILVVAFGGPIVLFEKGRERVFYAGESRTLYVHGPLYLKREAVLQMQPPPYQGPAQVFYKNRAYTDAAELHTAFYCGQKYIGKVDANEIIEFELNPGTYWLSTGKDGEEELRLEVEANHQYYVERNAQGLVVKNFDDNPGLLDDGPLPRNRDFTSASPEVTTGLLAMPLSGDAAESSY